MLTRSLVIRYENVDLIDELKLRTRIALDARAAAEAANRAKSQLLAAASHDLRQPLHALGLYVAALSARAREAEWRPLVDHVESAASTLEMQFAQLIDLSRLDAGALMPECSPMPLDALFARIRAEFAPQAAARGLTFRTVADASSSCRTDASLLERIVGNLAANAIRYTNRGGVLIGARRCGGRVAIDVVDTGIGIAPADRDARLRGVLPGARRRRLDAGAARHGTGPRDRAPFRRAARSRDRARFAAGYRLAVSSARSRASLRVTRVRIGRARPHRRPPQSTFARSPARSSPSSTTIARRSTQCARCSQTWGAVVAGGATPDALLASVGELERYPDLIVADLRLANNRSGIDAVRQLRDEMGFAIPAIVVSGDTGTRADREARQAGLTLLPKPVVGATLCSAAITALQRSARSLATSRLTG